MMIARWRIDARFGHKQAVIDSLSPWHRDIGSEVGWTDDKLLKAVREDVDGMLHIKERREHLEKMHE